MNMCENTKCVNSLPEQTKSDSQISDQNKRFV